MTPAHARRWLAVLNIEIAGWLYKPPTDLKMNVGDGLLLPCFGGQARPATEVATDVAKSAFADWGRSSNETTGIRMQAGNEERDLSGSAFPAHRRVDVRIRTETPADYEAIGHVTRQAFGQHGDAVAELVELIRGSANYIPALALVADYLGQIVGHIVLSYLTVEDAGNVHQVVTLSPLSVVPSMQRKGVGSALVTSAIDRADRRGESLIVLEGHPGYYPRFGFRPAKTLGVQIDLPSWAPEEAAMVYPLRHYRPDIKGRVVYPAAFSRVSEAARATAT